MHTIYPFGVGALKEIGGESFVACDISRWSDEGVRLLGVDRLLRNFGLSELRMADASKRASGVPYYRFPEWHFCEDRKCRALRQLTFAEQEAGPKCEGRQGVKHRSRAMKPVRYVQVCAKGHMQEIDWFFWVHIQEHHRQCRDRSDIRMEFDRSKNKTVVKCGVCDAARDVEDLIGAPKPGRETKCQGRHPWEKHEKGGQCDLFVHYTQRGAGNVWFPHGESGIVIPPDSDYSAKKELLKQLLDDRVFRGLSSAPNSPMAPNQRQFLRQTYDITDAEIDEYLRAGKRDLDEVQQELGDMFEEEWVALTDAKPTGDPRSDFVIEPVPLNSFEFVATSMVAVPDWLSSVTMVHRLREIRVLHGFTRVFPYSTAPIIDDGERGRATLVSATLGDDTWRPAVEVFGEGVFVTLNEQLVKQWEARAEVLARIPELKAAASSHIMGPRLIPHISPRYLLLHSFAHALIREISFDCGYPVASLRERIYATRNAVRGLPMCGVLVYTADADSEGSMGGLVAQAKPDRILGLLERTIASMSWCSLDPVCGETVSAGGLNNASCHACCLLPENSCEMSNLILDRRLISPDTSISFFQGVG
jgi:hypothetical protein